jgi:transposase
LLQVRSIGPEIATVLAKEVFYRCFASRRHVAAYAGLTPSPFASGRRSREQGITKAGNARARKALIELAWLWVRNQPDSALATWFRSRVGSATGRVRRIAIVALARKLLILLWRYVETGALPADVAVKP